MFIRKIILRGPTALTKKEIEQVAFPYQNQWLSPKDIRSLLEAIKHLYIGKGFLEASLQVSHQIKDRTLIITVKNIAHALICHYFVVSPSIRIQEVLAAYVEYQLRSAAQ